MRSSVLHLLLAASGLVHALPADDPKTKDSHSVAKSSSSSNEKVESTNERGEPISTSFVQTQSVETLFVTHRISVPVTFYKATTDGDGRITTRPETSLVDKDKTSGLQSTERPTASSDSVAEPPAITEAPKPKSTDEKAVPLSTTSYIITSCPPDKKNCEINKWTTEIITLTTSLSTATSTYVVTSCPPEKAGCEVGQTTVEVIVYTTTCPASTVMHTTRATSVVTVGGPSASHTPSGQASSTSSSASSSSSSSTNPEKPKTSSSSEQRPKGDSSSQIKSESKSVDSSHPPASATPSSVSSSSAISVNTAASINESKSKIKTEPKTEAQPTELKPESTGPSPIDSSSSSSSSFPAHNSKAPDSTSPPPTTFETKARPTDANTHGVAPSSSLNRPESASSTQEKTQVTAPPDHPDKDIKPEVKPEVVSCDAKVSLTKNGKMDTPITATGNDEILVTVQNNIYTMPAGQSIIYGSMDCKDCKQMNTDGPMRSEPTKMARARRFS